MKNIFHYLIVLLFLASYTSKPEVDPWIISAPAGKQFTHINKAGTTVIPNGRLLTPAGKSIVVASHPYGLTLSPDGNTAVTANSGTNPLSITVIRNILSQNPDVQQIPPGPPLPTKVCWLPYLWD